MLFEWRHSDPAYLDPILFKLAVWSPLQSDSLVTKFLFKMAGLFSEPDVLVCLQMMFRDFITDWIGLKYFDGTLHVSILTHDSGACLMIWWMRHSARCEFWMFTDMWPVFVRSSIWVGVSICLNLRLNRLPTPATRGGAKAPALYTLIEVDYAGA